MRIKVKLIEVPPINLRLLSVCGEVLEDKSVAHLSSSMKLSKQETSTFPADQSPYSTSYTAG
jgi:hypothetical protein